MEVVDKYGLYHHRPVIDGEPSSNNGWIYTAYALALGFQVKGSLVFSTFLSCTKLGGGFYNRLPGRETPPISRDEIIGMFYLKVLDLETLMGKDWRIHPSPRVGFFKRIKAIYRLIGKHRNYVWENKITDAYSTVFKLPLHDRYYMKKVEGLSVTFFEHLAFKLYFIVTLIKKDKGELNLLWLQLEDLDYQLMANFIDMEDVIMDIYPDGHPFRGSL